MPTDFASDPQLDDAEVRMRQSLGIAAPSGAGPVASSSNDPLKGARQAIRSQAAAREYAERQLAHAEATIQDLRRKLHQAYRDKDAAVAAAQSAVTAKLKAERVLVATEAALTAEKAAHNRADRVLAEAQATIRDLQARLNVADQDCQAAKADLAAERQARQKAEDALRDALADRANTAPIDRDEPTVTADRGGGGRSRKKVTAQPKQVSAKPPGNARAVSKSVTKNVSKPSKPQRTARTRFAADQEPVQWWGEGWKP